MPTFDFYGRVAERVENKLQLFHWLIFLVWLGGIPVIYFVNEVADSKSATEVAMKVIWSIWCILLATTCCGHWIIPNKHPADRTSREGFMVFMLNIYLIFSVVPWFWVD